jgi:hypothetical protein
MSGNVVLSWNRAALEAVRQTRMGPPDRGPRPARPARGHVRRVGGPLTTWPSGPGSATRLRRPPAERTQEAKREAVSFAAHRPWSTCSPPRPAPSPS